MNKHDFEAFSTAWIDAVEMTGKEASGSVIMLAFKVLAGYELDDVLNALAAHLADPDVGRFMPKPADIVLRIDGSNKLPSVDALIGLAHASSKGLSHTPIGFYARMQIGDFNLGSLNMYDLRALGEQALAGLPAFIEQARAGTYDQNVRGLMVKHGMDGCGELAPGIKGPPADLHPMIQQQMQQLAAPPDDTPAVSDSQAKSNIIRLKNMLSDGNAA